MNVENDPNPVGKCPYCGYPVLRNDNYCSNCGAKNDNWSEAAPEECGNCHAQLLSGDRYCRVCGTKAGENAEETSDAEFGVMIDTPDPSDMYFLPIDDAIDEAEWEEKEDE